MPSSNWRPATVEDGWESSDQLTETTDEDAESSDQLAETTDEGAESSDQPAETQSDDWESSDQLSEAPNEELTPTTAPPKYSSVQTVADIETGSSYELQGNMVQGQRVIDLESGQSGPTKPRKNWAHKVGRMLTLENVLTGFGIAVGGAFALGFIFIMGLLMWDLIIYIIKTGPKIND